MIYMSTYILASICKSSNMTAHEHTARYGGLNYK